MDERVIKRLLIIFGASLIAIFIVKAVVSRTIINLNKVAAEKKREALKPPAEQQANTPAAIILETPAVSTVVEAAAPEPSSASGASEVR